MSVRTVSVAIKAEVAGLVNGLTTAGRSVKQFGDELGNLGSESPDQLNDIAVATAAVGLSLSGMAGYAVTAAMAFDKQMSEVSSVANATGKDLQGLRDLAIQAGQDTQYSAMEAAKAEAELAKAGIQTSDIMGGALSGSLALAAAGQMDLADAATIAAQTMNIFELKGQNVTHIADVLASAANTSAADMHDLGLGLQQVGLVAHQAGFSLEETVGVLAAFADRGLEGSDGATSLKTAIQRLTAPVDQAKTLMDALGISVYDANGKVKSAADLAGILQKQLGGLSNEQRNAAMNTIFGSDAIRAASVLYNLGADGVKKYTAAVDQNGAAAETARKKTDNLAGDIERLKGSMETLAIQAGSGANGGLRVLAQAADGAVNAFAGLPAPVQTTATVLVGLGGAGLLAGAGLLKARQTAQEAMAALTAMGPAGARAATALGTVGSVAGKLGLAGLAIGGMWMGLNALSDWADKKHAPVKANIEDLTDSMKQFADSGRVAGELASKYGESLQKIGSDVTGLTKAMADLKQTQADVAAGLTSGQGLENWNPVDPQQSQRIKDLDTALSGLVKNGGATQAKLFMDQLMSSGKLTADQFAALTGMLPQYQAAADAAGLSNTGLAKGFGDTETNARTMAGSLNAAVQAGQSLKDVFDQLNGGFINSTQAAINAEANIDALTESVKQHGNSLDIDTAAGQSNVGIIVKGAQMARDAAQAKYEETGSLEAAKATYDGYIGKLRTTAGDLQFNKQKTDALFTSISNMPPLKATQIQLPGIDSAIEKVIGLQTRLNGLQNRTITTTVVQNTVTGETRTQSRAGPAFNRWGGITEHAQTGLLREAGVFSPAGPARYAFAEPATGGEAFVPKNGDYGRSMSILSQAASWYGAAVMPRVDSDPGYAASPDALAVAIARELAPMMAQMADRPVNVNVDGQRIAQAVKQGNRSLERQG